MSKPRREGNDCKGVSCPQCGCCHHYTTHTLLRRNKVRRRRVCRHCGKVFMTTELTSIVIQNGQDSTSSQNF